MNDRLLVWAFRAAWSLLPRIPERTARRIAFTVADLAWLRNGTGVRQLERNLGRVVLADAQTVRDLTREALRRYADYWRTMFQLSAMTVDEISSRVVFHNLERVDQALAHGKGVILASTHSGNWDIAGIAVARHFNGISTVAERLKPEALFEAFVSRRAPYGFEIFPHKGGPRPAFELLKERLEQGRPVALVSDRDLSRRGIDVDFFDGRARMAAGPAALAHATGAALIPCGMWVEGDTVHVLAHEPLTVPDGIEDPVPYLTQRLADVYARDIALHPTDWHMLQPVWLEDL